jgi:pilus assembly protein FimV
VLDRGAAAEAAGDDLLSATSLLRTQTSDLSKLEATATDTPVVDLSEATGELPTIVVDELDATGEMERPGSPHDEDSTMSEVGTKLDLARAYIDMGDPEGARSILDEVLKEGSPVQRKEAERLLAGLP